MKLLSLLAPLVLSTTLHAALDTAEIESITGLKGTASEAEGTFKVTAPRADVKIAVDGWTMPPFMGLTTWAAFKAGTTSEAMCAGDIVVFEDEVNPVMSAALEGGLNVTALHNHFMGDEPKVYFMKGTPAGAQKPAQGRNKYRRHSPAHDDGGAALSVPPLLGQGPRRQTRRQSEEDSRPPNKMSRGAPAAHSGHPLAKAVVARGQAQSGDEVVRARADRV